MKIAVIGPGAMGLFFTARLHQAGHEVWLLDHRPERAAHLQHQGLTLLDLRAGTVTTPCRSPLPPRPSAPVIWS